MRRLAFAFALCAAASISATAQEGYPSRPVTLIVPFAAGGSTDVIARVVADAMRGPFGQSIVIDNRGGAGGSIGTAAVAKAAPDGYTIGMGTASTLAINPAAYKSLPYDVINGLEPVGTDRAGPERHHRQSEAAGEDGSGTDCAG